jgi:hypothetical protein
MLVKAEALRSSLHELEGLLEEYSPLMTGSIQKSVDRAIKYGAALGEVSTCASTRKRTNIDTFQLSPIAKAIFGVASVTFEVCAR